MSWGPRRGSPGPLIILRKIDRRRQSSDLAQLFFGQFKFKVTVLERHFDIAGHASLPTIKVQLALREARLRDERALVLVPSCKFQKMICTFSHIALSR
ncbi:hypothetical protein JQ607_09250 [Bradyrhizobium liaoningense]|uniref:hypothetical protein n=1 Tax=Bradyrhizobium liaoningense TaxID=43992 RepID=UPI001BA8FAFB|nr:hypothetical protein [Bradyrhizobium liaoningense]MBR0840373.1 hypothetical protein [Bradyrhizobium liaoningense]